MGTRITRLESNLKFEDHDHRGKSRAVDPPTHQEAPISYSFLAQAKLSNLGPCMVSTGPFNFDEALNLPMQAPGDLYLDQIHQPWFSVYMATAHGSNQTANPSRSTLSRLRVVSSRVMFVARKER